MPREHTEFSEIDMENGWEDILGYPKGYTRKILSSDLGESAKHGHRTRLIRIAPGAYTTNPSSMIIGRKSFCLAATWWLGVMRTAKAARFSPRRLSRSGEGQRADQPSP